MTDTPITLTADAPAQASPEARTITGRIIEFGKPSTAQRVTVTAGALTPREPLSRVKLLLDHDHTKPVGHLVSLDISDSDATAVFKVAEGTAGDEALASAKAGLRDGLSVGIAVKNGEATRDGGIRVTAAELFEVSLVAVPDFASASVTSVTAAAKDNTTMTDTATTIETATEPNTTEAVESPRREFAAPTTTTPRPLDLRGAVTLMANAINSGSPDAIRLALADIIPSDDAGTGFVGRDSWLGELWTAAPEERWWIDAFGTPQQLTSIKGKGWRWTTKPKPGKYTGNKSDVPSEKIATESTEFTAERWAGGWDIDRIFIDLADPGFLESFWLAAMSEYKINSNRDIGTKVLAAATASTASGVTTALGGVKQLAKELRAIGASASTVFLSADLFDEWAELKTSEVPFWLANLVGGVDLNNGTVTQAGLSLRVAADAPEKTIVAIDRRAAVIREKTPIRINGVDIARGGIDLGFFSYGRLDIHDPRAIRKITITPEA